VNNPTFIGWQELPKGIGGGKMALFNLNEKLGEHPVGSTVSDRMLMQNGYNVVLLATIINMCQSEQHITPPPPPRREWQRVTDPMNPPTQEYLNALRPNGDPITTGSCESVREPVSELSGSHSPPATDAAGEQATARCNNPGGV